MPIKRENYAADWEAISDRIRFERAQGKCEACGVAHGAVGARDANGQWHDKADIDAMAPAALGELYPDLKSRKMIVICLTVGHHDRDTKNNSEWNLFAWCQACHLGHDRHDNWQRRRRNQQQRQAKAGQKVLLTEV